MSRIVRLLDDPVEDTPAKKARRRYWQSPAGKATKARYRAKLVQSPEWRAKEVARVKAWRAANRVTCRVYKRIWQQVKRRKENPA